MSFQSMSEVLEADNIVSVNMEVDSIKTDINSEVDFVKTEVNSAADFVKTELYSEDDFVKVEVNFEEAGVKIEVNRDSDECEETIVDPLHCNEPGIIRKKKKKIYPFVTCEECGKVMRKNKLKSHISVVHRCIKSFPCDHCEKMFSSNSNVQKHVSSVHEKVRFPCPYCKKEYVNLQDHIKTIHEAAQTECGQCGKVLSNLKSLQNHIKKVHSKEETQKKFDCGICGMQFVYQTSKSKHEKTVHSNIKEKCPLCDKSIKDVNNHLYKVHNTKYKDAKNMNIIIKEEN